MSQHGWFRSEWERSRRTVEYCTELIELEGVSAELGELAAHHLISGANSIGGIINLVDLMAKLGWKAIYDEADAYEVIMEHGEEVMLAMRTIAMRIDRAVMTKGLDDVLLLNDKP